MAIERWNPFHEAVSLRDAMNTLLQDSFVRPSGWPAADGAASFPLDISESEDEFVVHASLPGVKPEDVQIRSSPESTKRRPDGWPARSARRTWRPGSSPANRWRRPSGRLHCR